MNNQIILDEKFTEDQILKCLPVNLKEEVWNPKSPNFLNFEHFRDSEEYSGGLTAVNKVTHGFKMNRNKRIYGPRELKLAADSILTPYPAPIKNGHSAGGDDGPVIGRAVRAKYVPKKSDDVIDVNLVNKLKATDKMFHQAIQNAAKKGFFGKDNGGAGYLEGVSKITDKDAIEKILDGRLMTVSVEMMTSKWLDPGSGEAWDYDLLSKFQPGRFDEDKVFHALLATDLQIEGWAYVTHPADREAVLLSSMKDSIVQEFKEMAKTPTFYFGNINYKNINDSVLSNLDSSICEDHAIDGGVFADENTGLQEEKEEVMPLATDAEKYSNISFSPPQSVRAAAKRGLEVRASKPPSERGGTAIGVARARDLSNGKDVSPDTARRMKAYFDRHEIDKKGSTWSEQGKGWQAWHLWGGDPGQAWSAKLVRQMNSADEGSDANAASEITNDNNNANGDYSMLINKYKEGLDTGTETVKVEEVVSELYGKDCKVQVVNALMYKGIPIASNDAFASVLEVFGETPELERLSIVLDALLDGRDSLVEVVDSKEDSAIDDNNKTEQSIADEEVSVEMNLESVIGFIRDNKEAVISELNLVDSQKFESLQLELDSIRSQKEELQKKLDLSASDSVKLGVLRDELRSMSQEITTSQVMFNQVTSDSTAMLAKVAKVLSAVGCEVSLEDDFIFATNLDRFNKAIDSLDLELIRSKVNALGKDPVTELVAADHVSEEEVKVEYNKAEIRAARNYESLVEDSGIIAANNYWSKQIKQGFVRPDLKAKQVLDSIK
jgi:hypothetical protein